MRTSFCLVQIVQKTASALLQRNLLYEAVANSNLSESSSFNQVQSSSSFGVYVETLQIKCQLPRFAKRVIKWFNESKGNSSKAFDYRFTGKALQALSSQRYVSC